MKIALIILSVFDILILSLIYVKDAYKKLLYSINEKPQAYNLSKRITTELSNAIKKGGVKEFVKNLTVDGRAWLEKNHISPKGKFKDKTIYPNVSTIATKLKLDKDELIKELTKKK